MKSKITNANLKDSLHANLVTQILDQGSSYTRILYFGQVISNNDPKNLNRIKVRIPIIDDVYYANNTKENGDDTLPWSLPFNSRFIETPEVNSIVYVLLSDPKTPYFGRIYFDSVTDLSATDLFEKLKPEEQALSNWLNAENSLEITIPKPIPNNKFNATQNIKYQIGIRGKGNNKLEFNQTSTTLVQNYKDKDKESLLNLDVNSKLEAADELRVVSKKGTKKEYNPVFDDELFKHLDNHINLFMKIVLLLNSVPATSPTGPCTAAPNAGQLISELKSLKQSLITFKRDGSSKKIIIN